jgi:hypothetical protein
VKTHFYGGTYLLWNPQAFVKTDEFRNPKKGEYFLSGAIPTVYKAYDNLNQPYWIMRPATEEETRCALCKQPLPLHS